MLDEILRDGRAAGVFRDDVVSALDVQSGDQFRIACFQVANRYTFGYLFDVDLAVRHRLTCAG